METNFQASVTYIFGVLERNSAREENTGNGIRFLYRTHSHLGNVLLAKNCPDAYTFFLKNPFGFNDKHTYTIFYLDQFGNKKYFAEGQFQPKRTVKKNNQLSDDYSKNHIERGGGMISRSDDSYKEEIGRLNSQILNLHSNIIEVKAEKEQLQNQIEELTKQRDEYSKELVEIKAELRAKKLEEDLREKITKGLSDEYEKKYLEEAKAFRKEQESGFGDLGNMLMPLAQMFLPKIASKIFGEEGHTQSGFQDHIPENMNVNNGNSNPVELDLDEEETVENLT